MSRVLGFFACALALAGCVTAPPPDPAPVPVFRVERPVPQVRAPGPVALRNADLAEEMGNDARCAPGWSCTMHGRPDAFRFFADRAGGKSALCVEPVKKEPWAIVAQGVKDPALRGTRVRFSIDTRLVGVSGERNGGAGPWAQVQVPRTQTPKLTAEKLASGTADWTTQTVEMDVPADAVTFEVGLMLRGTGRACFREARLEVLRASKNPV